MNQLQKPYFLISDMDRTLLNNESCVSDENIEAIRAFVEAGGLFTVASGRPPRSILMYPKLKELLRLPFIAFNGCCIYDPVEETVLYQECIPESVYGKLVSIVQKFPSVALMALRQELPVYVVQPNHYAIENMEREQVIPETIDGSIIPAGICKFIFSGDNPELMKISDILSRSALPVQVVLSEENFLEISAEGNTKGAALQRIIGMLGLQKEQIIAVGDGLNDLTMLQCAHVDVAVSNASHRLKPLVHYHCCSNEEHAIRQVISTYCM